MGDEELKGLIGEAAFNALSADQKTALMGKFTPAPKSDPKEDPAPKSDPKDDGDLRDKIKKEKEAQDQKASEQKSIEGAVTFTLGLEGFLKEHEDILPSTLSEILKASGKEKYDSVVEKASVLKSNFIQEFFAVQAHVDLLTPAQKSALEDYLKLTKNGKEQKAAQVYENLFEPALQTLKQVKKAEELGKARSGFASGSKVEDGYKQRLMAKWNRK